MISTEKTLTADGPIPINHHFFWMNIHYYPAILVWKPGYSGELTQAQMVKKPMEILWFKFILWWFTNSHNFTNIPLTSMSFMVWWWTGGAHVLILVIIGIEVRLFFTVQETSKIPRKPELVMGQVGKLLGGIPIGRMNWNASTPQPVLKALLANLH